MNGWMSKLYKVMAGLMMASLMLAGVSTAHATPVQTSTVTSALPARAGAPGSAILAAARLIGWDDLTQDGCYSPSPDQVLCGYGQPTRYLPDGDNIFVSIQHNVVNRNFVEFVLKSDVTWWKGINLPSGATIWTQDGKRSATSVQNFNQVRNGTLTFNKAKEFGRHRWIYTLRDQGRIQPGDRVTFRWIKD